jgi:hypothetical protein
VTLAIAAALFSGAVAVAIFAAPYLARRVAMAGLGSSSSRVRRWSLDLLLPAGAWASSRPHYILNSRWWTCDGRRVLVVYFDCGGEYPLGGSTSLLPALAIFAADGALLAVRDLDGDARGPDDELVRFYLPMTGQAEPD